jgi:hypothetical protein
MDCGRSLKSALFAVLGVWAGCGGGTPQPLTTPPVVWPLAVGATDGVVRLMDINVSATGAGSSRIASISMAHGSGQIELDGRIVPAAIYATSGLPGEGPYQALAVESGRIWVVWLYCSGHALGAVYYENTDGVAGTAEVATGTCEDTAANSTVSVKFPVINLPQMVLVPGFTIDGPGIQLRGNQPGAIELEIGGRVRTLLVFNVVDCTQCGVPGWTELHSLLWEQATRLPFST